MPFLRLLSSFATLVTACAFAVSAPVVAQSLFDDAELLNAVMSPDGRRIALLKNTAEGQAIESFDVVTGQADLVFSTGILDSEDVQVVGLNWVDTQKLIFRVVQTTDGIGKLIDTKSLLHVFVKDVDPQQPLLFLQSEGDFVDPLPDSPNEILFAVSGSTSYVYRVDTSRLNRWGAKRRKTDLPDGGELSRANRVAEIEAYALQWVTGASGSVRGVMTVDDDPAAVVFSLAAESGDWIQQKLWPIDEKKRSRKKKDDVADDEDIIYVPLASIAGTDDFVVVSRFENEEALYRYNYTTGEKTLLYDPPGNEIVDVRKSYDDSALLEVSYLYEGAVQHHYFSDVYSTVLSELQRRFPEQNLRIMGADAEQRRYLVWGGSPARAGVFYVYSSESDSVLTIGAEMPWLAERAETQTLVGQVVSEDLNIEYILSVPDGPGPYPLVVYPHGGPWAIADIRGFDPLVQNLIDHDIAVLQVNYRGSGGYGVEFIEAGIGEFGDLALADIERSIDAAVGRPDIDGRRICTMGASYGGYAALMLPVRRPDSYRCAVSVAAPTDLVLLVDGNSGEFAEQLMYMIIGERDVDDEAYNKLRTWSPLHRADDLNVPVLIAQGGEDRRVDLEHGLRMHLRLEQLNKPHEWLLYPEQGHSFGDADKFAEFAEAALSFMQPFLGAKKEPVAVQ